MDRAAAELLLASLFVETTPERLEALKNALANTKDFGGFVPALAHHGVVLLFQRNLAAAGIEPPPTLTQQLTLRAGEERHVALRARLSLQRFLAAAGREHVEVTAVRSSALALDLYPEPMRTQRELELFVPPEQLTRALAAARSAGLAPDAGELPPWWTRAAHGELRLRGSSAHLAPVRLSTRLHHPSLLVAAREPELLARRRRIKIEGHELFLLEPLDALLELALTLATRAGLDTLTTGRRHLLTAASSASSPLRLAELCDLRTFLERPDVTLSAGALVARAHEWNAEAALRAALECVLMGLGLQPGARDFARAVAGPLAATPTPNQAVFHPDPFERLPHWLRPSAASLERVFALPTGSAPRALQLARARHLARAAALGLTALLAYPAALLARQLSRSTREQVFADLGEPSRQADLVDAFKTTARIDDLKPITPRTIALEPREESASKYPDHYRG